jgi:hypothetical protein
MPTSIINVATNVGPTNNLYIPTDTANLSVSSAIRYLKLTPSALVEDITIKDTAANIQRNLAALNPYIDKITSLRADADKTITVTGKQYDAYTTLISKWTSDISQKINLTDLSISQADSYKSLTTVNKLSIKETAVNIQNKYSELLDINNSGKLLSINQTNSSTLLKLSYLNFTDGIANVANETNTNLLSKINKGNYKLKITGANVSAVLTASSLNGSLALKDNPKVKAITILDSTKNIDDNISALQRVGMKIETISQSVDDSDRTLNLTTSEIKSNSTVLNKIITGYDLAAEHASAGQLAFLLSNRKVIKVDIEDTGSNISRNWNSLNTYSNSINLIEVLSTAPNIINIKHFVIIHIRTFMRNTIK